MRKPLGIAAALLAVILIIPSTAQARHHQYRHHHYRHYHNIQTYDSVPAVAYYRDGNVEYGGHTVSHPSGCPGRAFCGCGVSVRVFGHPIRSLFLASNWFKFPRTSPASGMVAVRNHHVMYIEAYNGGGVATVYDPNSGGRATRVHTRSIAGYAIVNPHGGRYAAL